MLLYVAYDSNGMIRQKGSAQNADSIFVHGASILVVDQATYDALENTSHAWVDVTAGPAVVPYTADQRAARESQPTPSAQWDEPSKAWIDVRSLQDLKDDKWAAMKLARDQVEFGGFAWDGSTFDSDTESQSRIQGAAQLATLAMLASQAFSVDWTLADNTVRTLSGAEVLEVGRAMGEHIVSTHATGRDVRAAIEAAATRGEVDQVSWPFVTH